MNLVTNPAKLNPKIEGQVTPGQICEINSQEVVLQEIALVFNFYGQLYINETLPLREGNSKVALFCRLHYSARTAFYTSLKRKTCPAFEWVTLSYITDFRQQPAYN